MSKRIIQKTIKIDASVGKVWRVFTDPIVTRQMEGEYVTDWKVGSALGWKGKDGKIYKNGMVLEIEKERLIKHNLVGMEQEKKMLSIITYRFVDSGTQTILQAQEELYYEMTDGQYKEAMEGWDYALNLVKDTAERI